MQALAQLPITPQHQYSQVHLISLSRNESFHENRPAKFFLYPITPIYGSIMILKILKPLGGFDGLNLPCNLDQVTHQLLRSVSSACRTCIQSNTFKQ